MCHKDGQPIDEFILNELFGHSTASKGSRLKGANRFCVEPSSPNPLMTLSHECENEAVKDHTCTHSLVSNAFNYEYGSSYQMTLSASNAVEYAVKQS